MIFGSLGLLVLSLMLLIFGITRTSLTLLIMALCATGLAAVLLIAAYQAHKVRLAASGEGPVVGGAAPGPYPGVPSGAQTVYFVPVAANGQPLMMGTPGFASAAAPQGASNGNDGAHAPLVGYDEMNATQLVRLIGSGALSDEQMQAIAAYEENHQARKTVMQALQGTKSDR